MRAARPRSQARCRRCVSHVRPVEARRRPSGPADRVRDRRRARARRRVDRLDVDDPEHHVLQLVARTRGRARDPRDRTVVGHGGDVRTHRPDGAGRGRHGQADRPVSVQQRQPARVVVLSRRVSSRERAVRPSGASCSSRSPTSRSSTPGGSQGFEGPQATMCSSTSVLVPLERTASPIFDRAPHDEPHYRWSFFALLGSLMAGVPIGVARRSLDEFFALAERKSRGGEGSLATEQVTQLAVAQCEGSLRAAAGFVEDSIGAAWDTALGGDDISREQRLAIRLSRLPRHASVPRSRRHGVRPRRGRRSVRRQSAAAVLA